MGRKPSRASDAIATAFAATCDFMSSAPRPQTSPSRTSPEAAWELMSEGAPPVKALVESLDRDRRARFRRALVEYWSGFETADGVREPRRYLLVLGRRR